MSLFGWSVALGVVLGLCFHRSFRSVVFAVLTLCGVYGRAYYRQLARRDADDDAAYDVADVDADADAAVGGRAAGANGIGRDDVVRARAALQTPVRPAFVEREGYLTRRARNFPWTWDKRYYVLLTPNSGGGSAVRIAYYEHALKGTLLGEFDCVGGVVLDSDEREHAFHILTPTRKLLCAAVDASDKHQWMHAITHNLRLLEQQQHAAAAANDAHNDVTVGGGAGPVAVAAIADTATRHGRFE